jgi:hypothetical protein
MAKKQETKSKEFNISALNDFLTAECNDQGSLIEDNEAIKINDWIGTGIYIVNALISGSIFKGIPGNRITAFGGKPGVGKTFLALNACREAQKQGYFVVYIDSEGSVSVDSARALGCDLTKFRIDPIFSIEKFKVYMSKLLDKLEKARQDGFTIPKLFLVLDSIGMLASEKELNDAINDEIKADFTGLKQSKSLFRILAGRLAHLGIPMVITSHTYDAMSMYGGEVWGGGSGFEYACSGRFRITKAKLKTEELDDMGYGKNGIVATLYADKNRFAVPKKASCHIDFKQGANPFVGLEFFCTAETYEKVGIVKGTVTKNPDGTETVEEKGNMWYVRHLGKKIHTATMWCEEVFTPEVLKNLDVFIQEYFSYKKIGAAEEFDKIRASFDKKLGTDDMPRKLDLDDSENDSDADLLLVKPGESLLDAE